MCSFNKGVFWVLALTTCGILVAPPLAFAQSQAVPFCDDFEDGAGFLTRWTISQPTVTPVNSPMHSGTWALKFRGLGGGACGADMYRTGFEACAGEYSAWVNQQHFQAGFSICIQVQPGPSPHPQFREAYEFILSAQNSEGPSFLVLHCHETGPGTVLGTKPSTQFLLGEWIRVFMRRLPDNRLVAGYERNGAVDSLVVADPTPVVDPGAFYLLSCSDGPPTDNFYDDVCYAPLPCILPVCFDRGADVNCDGIAGDVFDVIAAIDIAFQGGTVVPCASKP